MPALAARALGIEIVAPLPVKPFGPVQLIVNGPVPLLTVTVKLPVAPAQTGAGGAMVQVGLDRRPAAREAVRARPANRKRPGPAAHGNRQTARSPGANRCRRRDGAGRI